MLNGRMTKTTSGIDRAGDVGTRFELFGLNTLMIISKRHTSEAPSRPFSARTAGRDHG